ncbi:S1 family serine peptidase [Streptomyces sp. bgisy126]|uniref:S1 family serine peptidase n=1 Tax=unclassified Streptomyces TaxID=2593676 RepID=UPI003EC07FD8
MARARGGIQRAVAALAGVMLAAATFAAVGTGTAAAKPASPPVAQVVGGTDSAAGAYPYQVSLQVPSGASWRHNCGGSVIGERWVLTAAHCLAGRTASGLRVVTGTHTLDSGGAAYAVQELTVHEGYNASAPGMPNDIGLVKLASPLAYTSLVQPVAPATVPDVLGGSATLTGWGQTSGGNSSLPNTLQQATVTVLPIATCQMRWLFKNITPLAHVCTFDKQPDATWGKSACNGDSGGPLVQNGIQIGVVSWGVTNCSGNYPSVYANVGAYRPWITTKTGI